MPRESKQTYETQDRGQEEAPNIVFIVLCVAFLGLCVYGVYYWWKKESTPDPTVPGVNQLKTNTSSSSSSSSSTSTSTTPFKGKQLTLSMKLNSGDYIMSDNEKLLFAVTDKNVMLVQYDATAPSEKQLTPIGSFFNDTTSQGTLILSSNGQLVFESPSQTQVCSQTTQKPVGVYTVRIDATTNTLSMYNSTGALIETIRPIEPMQQGAMSGGGLGGATSLPFSLAGKVVDLNVGTLNKLSGGATSVISTVTSPFSSLF